MTQFRLNAICSSKIIVNGRDGHTGTNLIIINVTRMPPIKHVNIHYKIRDQIRSSMLCITSDF